MPTINSSIHRATVSLETWANAPSSLQAKTTQRLGRIATVDAAGQPHVVPVTFRYNPAEDAIEIGGHGGFARRKKYRWTVRGIEIRGEVEILPTGGAAIVPSFDPEMFRLRPKRIISWGIDGAMSKQNARSVA